MLLKTWVYVIRRTNLPVNHHPRICSKYFVNAEGRRLYQDEIQPLSLARPFISSSNKRRKPARYRSESLGDEPVTVVVTTVRSIAPRVNSIATGSSPRLANRYLRAFLQFFPKLRLLLGKVNDGTSSGYKRLPSAFTKCLQTLPLRSLKLFLQARQLPLDSRA